jgi:hypothetical protein
MNICQFIQAENHHVSNGTGEAYEDSFCRKFSSVAAGCAEVYTHDSPRFKQSLQLGHWPLHLPLRDLRLISTSNSPETGLEPIPASFTCQVNPEVGILSKKEEGHYQLKPINTSGLISGEAICRPQSTPIDLHQFFIARQTTCRM